MSRILPAVLGWANGAGGTTDGENLQLYALDNGPSPRWEKPHGRTVEKALRERGDTHEGDRFLVVHLGDRFIDDDTVESIAGAVESLVEDWWQE